MGWIFKKVVYCFLVVLLLASCGAVEMRKNYVLCSQKNCGDENFSNSIFLGSKPPKPSQCKEEICFSPEVFGSGKSGIKEWTIAVFIIVPIILPTDYSSGDKEYHELDIGGYMKLPNGKIAETQLKEMSKNLSVKLIIEGREYIGKVDYKDRFFSLKFPINRKDFNKGELIIDNIYLNGKKFNTIRNNIYVDHYWETFH